MKKENLNFLKKCYILSTLMFITACSSTHYTYNVKPTPIKKKKSQYYVKQVNVDLSRSSQKEGYPNEKELENIISELLTKHLCKRNICAKSPNEESYDLYVDIDYTRNFIYISKAFNSLQLSHKIEVKKEDKVLATDIHNEYGVNKEKPTQIVGNFKRMLYLANKNDELKEINIVLKSISKDLYELGKK